MERSLIEDLLKKGVSYLIFCYAWHNDETLCHILEMYDKDFHSIATRFEFGGEIFSHPEKHKLVIGYTSVNNWEYGLIEHSYLWDGQLQKERSSSDPVLFFDIEKNEVTPSGRVFNWDEDESPFLYSENPKELHLGWRSTNKAQLHQLATHSDEFVRLCVAKNPLTTQSTLEFLMGDLSFQVAEVAKSRFEEKGKWFLYHEKLQEVKTQAPSSKRLEWLARHPWSQIHLACLNHPVIEDAFLNDLAQHHEWEIQLEVLLHPNASEKTKFKALEKLLTSSVNVQMRLAEHRRSPSELLEALEKEVKDERVLARIALHPNNKKRSRFVD